MPRLPLAFGLPFLALVSCGPAADVHVAELPTVPHEPPLPADPAVFAEAPSASPRLAPGDLPALERKIDQYFADNAQRRLYVQTDKPLYRPGETVWVRSFDLNTDDFAGRPGTKGATYALIGPRGDVVVEKKKVKEASGRATNDVVIPDGAAGGRYTLRVSGPEGVIGEKEIVVQAYDPPRIQKKMEFVRDAYGPGDTVVATLFVARTTGEPLANHAVSGVVSVDGKTLPNVPAVTDAEGNVSISFALPADLEVGDGLLTMLVEDGGITESVSKRIPIVTSGLRFSAYPEGGDLVLGLSSRVYFEALDKIGLPADVEGRVVDDRGELVTRFRSAKDGLGRFDLTPGAGRRYHVEIVQPVGIAEHYPLPEARAEGCVLQTFDDFDSKVAAIRASVTCSQPQEVVVLATEREQRLDAARVQAGKEPAVVYLEPSSPELAKKQGVARVTVFDADEQPLAERVVFRNRTKGLSVEVKADRAEYGPRDTVKLDVKATDPDGRPVKADLALAVLDDTVVKFADDKQGHILSKLLLEPEIQGDLEEPNEYFEQEDGAGFAMDLLMGTRGYRRFEWKAVTGGEERQTVATGTSRKAGELEQLGYLATRETKDVEVVVTADAHALGVPAAEPAPQPTAPMAIAAAPPEAKPMAAKAVARDFEKAEAKGKRRQKLEEEEIAFHDQPMQQQARFEEVAQLDIAAADEDLGGGAGVGGLVGAGRAMPLNVDGDVFAMEIPFVAPPPPVPVRRPVEWAKVRVFPVPRYSGAADVRTDFRETVMFAPSVQTGEDGTASVEFTLSDAVTSFRVTTEGVGGGLVGRSETTIASKLPFHLDVKLPTEVSLGDRIDLPVMLANERDAGLDVKLAASLPAQLRARAALDKRVSLDAGERDARFLVVDVVGQKGQASFQLDAEATGLTDNVIREITVVPPGYPATFGKSGRLAERETFTVKVSDDAIDGTIEASLALYPSMLDTLTDSLAGLIATPGGCFEQTTTTNYPNVLILDLAEREGASPSVVSRARSMLPIGYQRLTSYESKSGGFEWFGADPGHEGLTAFGLLQFTDMSRVWNGVDDAMMDRTADWLKSRRDGAGGYTINPHYLHVWATASDVSSSYITWALVRSGHGDGLAAELDQAAKVGATSDDPYRVALAADALVRVKGRGADAKKALSRLASMQQKDGGFAEMGTSITQSSGRDLRVETAAIATMAFLKGGQSAEAQKSLDFLLAARLSDGRFGATQATVLALRAIVAVHESGALAEPGEVKVFVDGEPVGSLAYGKGRAKPELDLGKYLGAGTHTVELVHEGKSAVPYSLGADWRRVQPEADPNAPISLVTSLGDADVGMGEVVRLTAVVTNTTAENVPMTIARVGIPGGMAAQTWQLDDLKKRGVIDFYETRGGREVDLYFTDMGASEAATVPLELVANVPGHYTAPASSAYLYYREESKSWAAPVEVEIGR